MSAIKLSTPIEKLDEEIAAEHINWLVAQQSRCSFFPITQNDFYYGFVRNPAAWSGSRASETNISVEKKPTAIAFNEIEKAYKRARFKDKAEREQAEKFMQAYKKYQVALKEKFLCAATLKALEEFENLCSAALSKQELNAEQYKDIKLITQELASNFKSGIFSPLRIQTRTDCLVAHGLLTVEYLNKLKKILKPNKNNSALLQFEVLAKRMLDQRYATVKKRTRAEAGLESISAIANSIGLLTGIPAAVFGILGFFFPPLWFVSGILGYISLVSCISTAISTYQVLNSLIGYQRAPSTLEIVLLAIDLLVIPFYFLVGAVRSALGNLLQFIISPNNAQIAITSVLPFMADLWDNVVSNVFDLIFLKEITHGLKSFFKDLLPSTQLKNTKTATSFSAVRNRLLQTKPVNDVHELINNTRQHYFDSANLNGPITDQITTQAGISSNTLTPVANSKIHFPNRHFAYVFLEDAVSEIAGSAKTLRTVSSNHEKIITWDDYFISFGTSPEAKKINIAIQHYKTLKPDANFDDRISALATLHQETKFYLESKKAPNAKSTRRLFKVENLDKAVARELDSLKKAYEDFKQQHVTIDSRSSLSVTPVLVGFKHRR